MSCLRRLVIFRFRFGFLKGFGVLSEGKARKFGIIFDLDTLRSRKKEFSSPKTEIKKRENKKEQERKNHLEVVVKKD